MSDEKGTALQISISLPDAARQRVERFWATISEPMSAASDAVKWRFWRSQVRNFALILDEASQIADKHGVELKPLPPKFLVKFIENASREEGPDNLRDAWAALLVNASRSFDISKARYANFLSEISGVEAKIVASLANRAKKYPFTDAHADKSTEANFRFLINQEIKKYLDSINEDTVRRFSEFDTYVADFLNKMSVLPIEFTFVTMPVLQQGPEPSQRGWGAIGAPTEFARKHPGSLLVLENLGIVTFEEATIEKVSGFSVGMTWLRLTPLGYAFHNACTVPALAKQVKSPK